MLQLLGGSGNCGDSLAKGKLIRMGRGERALELLCAGGRVALVLQFVLCWGSALPTPTPSRGLWL